MNQPPTQGSECNNVWDDIKFYEWGIDLVWHDQSGNWIPDEYRYHPNDNSILNWYSYCDLYGITWDLPRLLPNWAIDEMDQFYRERYYLPFSNENDPQFELPEYKQPEPPPQQQTFPEDHEEQ